MITVVGMQNRMEMEIAGVVGAVGLFALFLVLCWLVKSDLAVVAIWTGLFLLISWMIGHRWHQN